MKIKFGKNIKNLEPVSKNSIKKYSNIWRRKLMALWGRRKHKNIIIKIKKEPSSSWKIKKKPTKLE